MKVGSLVELIRPFSGMLRENIEYPIIGYTYTVRGIIEYENEHGIWLEEIINPMQQHVNGLNEPAFDINSFRELQPPMDISELIEESMYQTV